MLKKRFFNKDLLFYIVMLAFPILQFCLFYIGVNGKSLFYSFQKITVDGTTWTTDTLVQAWDKITSPAQLSYIGRSFLAYLLTYFIGTFLALLFSYFIYKKLPLNGMFKIFLFLPSIISAIVIAIIFKNFVEFALPGMASNWFGKTIKGLFTNQSTMFPTIIFYNVFINFGTGVLMYSNAMGNISPDVIEAGKLDGCSPLREFFSIVIPSIFPTISTFAITSIAAIFVNQLSLVSLYMMSAPSEVQTIGYYLYVETLAAGKNEAGYPVLSAMGLFLTIVAVPLTLFAKYMLEKFGPSEK